MVTAGRWVSLVVLVMVVAACGGDDGASNVAEAERDNSQATQTGNGGDGTSSQTDNEAGNQDGFVMVDGTTYAFTYDNLGRCGVEGNDGMVVSFGNLLDDPDRQVTLSYGLAGETTSGDPIMQVIIIAEGGGTQQYYSAVGFGTTDVGSVESITVTGDTVRITGQLQRNADQTLVDFEAEATCDQ